MVTFIFRLSILTMIITIMIVVMTPVLSVNNLLYPLKIDSSYVSQQQIAWEKSLLDGAYPDTGMLFLYTPEQLNLRYMDVEFITTDSVKLRGWMVMDTIRAQSPLLLIIPDISEGAVNYLHAMKQFCDRGFNVCVMNMRAQGNSEGLYYDFTAKAAADVHAIIKEMKQMPFINHVAILGNRTGAAIAMKAVYDSASVADVLILQNPPQNLSRFFDQQATDEWGELIKLFMPALRRSYEQATGISIEQYNYIRMIHSIHIPQMIVASNFSSKKLINETIVMYHASEYYRKRLFIDNESYMKPTGFVNSKKYYDKISGFINSSLPSVSKKTRFRKLVLN